MTRSVRYCWLWVVLVVLVGCSGHKPSVALTLTEPQLARVGHKIFQNECAGDVTCLVHWNKGEAFPSLGIGHFIWYPVQVDGPFVESFPALIDFMRARSLVLPDWLASLEPFHAPWPDRDAFLAHQDSDNVQTLRAFLEQTRSTQAAFMFSRAQASMARVIAAAPGPQRAAIKRRLLALSATPDGVYALIDYVNFKGEGLAPGETYNGQGWGLLQVLQQMSDQDSRSAVQQFQQAAAVVLTRRADNAANPLEKRQWLRGWLNRLQTYDSQAE